MARGLLRKLRSAHPGAAPSAPDRARRRTRPVRGGSRRWPRARRQGARAASPCGRSGGVSAVSWGGAGEHMAGACAAHGVRNGPGSAAHRCALRCARDTSLFGRMILSEKSAAARDHAVSEEVTRSQTATRCGSESARRARSRGSASGVTDPSPDRDCCNNLGPSPAPELGFTRVRAPKVVEVG